MPNRPSTDPAGQQPPDKYDHSDHPTDDAKPDDYAPPSSAKRDDEAETRAGQRHSPKTPAAAGPTTSRVRRVDTRRGGA